MCLSGRARLERDTALIGELWSEGARTWSPNGSDDPDIAFLRVTVQAAEYWDAPSWALVMLYGSAKAVLTGETPHAGESEKLRMS